MEIVKALWICIKIVFDEFHRASPELLNFYQSDQTVSEIFRKLKTVKATKHTSCMRQKVYIGTYLILILQ